MEGKQLDIEITELMGLRVADRFGMTAIRLAQQEYQNRMRLQTIEKILRS